MNPNSHAHFYARTLNADLHCHSTVSDGTLSPEALAQRAAERGVQLWALTDHDELGGQERAREAAWSHGMAYVTGVEISVTFLHKTVHIVGLGVDEKNRQLVQGLAATRGGRGERAQEMAHSLARVGIEGAYEGALKYAGNPELLARTHIARHLVDTGVCKTMDEVFRRYLTEGKPGFVAHRWAALREAVRWIVEAGGVAIIAHPGRYGFRPLEEQTLFTEFITHGGRGVEVVTGSHLPAEYETYAAKARDYRLLASRGSDFHSPVESTADLGSLPALHASLTPVWTALKKTPALRAA